MRNAAPPSGSHEKENASSESIDGSPRKDRSVGFGAAPVWFPVTVLGLWAGLFFALHPDATSLIFRFWPIIPISFLAAAFANATAIGGGFLFVPLFIFGYGLPPVNALKLSLATQAFGMSSGAIGWSKNFIVTRALVIGSLASIAGLWVGTYEVTLSGLLVKKAFGWISLFIFVVIVLEIRYGELSHNLRIERDTLARAAFFGIACLFGGLVTAWTAIGIGEVVALYLLFVYRIRIESAIGTGVAVLAITSIAGFGFHSQLGGIPWSYLAFTVPGVLIGGRFGAQMGKVAEAWLRNRNASSAVPETPAPGTSAAHSPLKWLFAGVVLLDGIAMLCQVYLNG